MPPAPIPENEAIRQTALRECGILDTNDEPAFQFVTQAAADLCKVPIALISLVDRNRQWFKSKVGLEASETSRDQAFCAYAIHGTKPLIIHDASIDVRTRDNPLVTGEPCIRFYAGFPLEIETGVCLGTLCVIDSEPRTLSPKQLNELQALADHATELLRLHQTRMSIRDEADELRQILDAVPAYVYLKDDNNTIINLNRSAAKAMQMDVTEVRGKPTETFFPAEDAAAFLRDDLEVIDSNRAKLGIVEFHEGGNGSRRAIRTDKIPLESRTSTRRLVAIAEDITDLERTRSELKLHQDAIDQAAVVAITDPAGIIIHANDWFCRISGYTREELIGQSHRIINSGHHDKSFFIDLWRTIAAGNIWRGEVCNRRKDGSLYWMDTTIVPFVDERGKIVQHVSIRYDITTRVQHEHAIRELSSLRSAILDSPAAMVISTDLDGIVTTYNATAERSLGYTVDEVVGKLTPTVWHDLDEVYARADALSEDTGHAVLPGFDALVGRTHLTGEPEEHEWTLIRKDGTRYPAMLSVSCLLDEGGERIGYVCMARDLTELKAAEEKIAEGHLREKLALSASTAGVWDYHIPSGRVLWDETMFDLYGIAPTEDMWISYETWATAVHPEELATQEAQIQAVVRGETGSGRRVFRIRRADTGEIRHIESAETFRRGPSGAIERVIGTNRDITDRIRTQQEIAEARLRLELAIDGSNDGIRDWIDVNRDEEWWSDQFYRLLGYEPGEIEPTCSNFNALLHPKDHDACVAAVDRAILDESLFDLEYRLRTKSGQYKWFRGRAKVFGTANGGAIRMAGSIQDINDRKNLERDLQQKNEELQQFVYTASHDLKSPIVTISSYLGYMLEDLENGQLEDVRESIDLVTTAAKKLHSNVEDLLELSRVSIATPNIHDVSLTEIVQDAMLLHGPELEKRGVKFDLQIEHDTVQCDEHHLDQIILNLIGNALRHGCDVPAPKITIRSTTLEGGQAFIEVQDRGPGVPDEHADSIFGVFEQLSRHPDSTGIGLAIVRRAAEVYGGQAWYEHAVGGGANFCVRIPKQTVGEKGPADERESQLISSDSVSPRRR